MSLDYMLEQYIEEYASVDMKKYKTLVPEAVRLRDKEICLNTGLGNLSVKELTCLDDVFRFCKDEMDRSRKLSEPTFVDRTKREIEKATERFKYLEVNFPLN